jgi:hypothetical protein
MGGLRAARPTTNTAAVASAPPAHPPPSPQLPHPPTNRRNPQRYGKIFRLSFGPKTFVIISDPKYAKQILNTNADK